MCVSGSLGKSLLELIISARESWRALGRTRQRNAFHCSCERANTFSSKENDLGCRKHWQTLSQMRRSVWQPSRQWMNELWQAPQVTTGLDTSPPLSSFHSLTFSNVCSFSLFHSMCRFFTHMLLFVTTTNCHTLLYRIQMPGTEGERRCMSVFAGKNNILWWLLSTG